MLRVIVSDSLKRQQHNPAICSNIFRVQGKRHFNRNYTKCRVIAFWLGPWYPRLSNPLISSDWKSDPSPFLPTKGLPTETVYLRNYLEMQDYFPTSHFILLHICYCDIFIFSNRGIGTYESIVLTSSVSTRHVNDGNSPNVRVNYQDLFPVS